ncbi:hypothetical protein TSUD_194110 [Trifolium subterraneum]|uniref:Uncharacterized protein n=1 Tax=Trifolium subterraneum TaxID=3900 RepID=A0A2Z6NNM6_TRISU|nr:hypothetical protein TSUD_194110 [Trifolium subterraneum]
MIFDGKYPHTWSPSEVSPCGVIYMTAIPSNNNNNNNENMTEEECDDAEESNEIVQVIQEEP